MATSIPIMGPNSGNKELENCPPASHFRLTEKDLMQALGDPDATARRLGLKPGVRGIHVRYDKVPTVSSDMPPGWCCVEFDGNWYCVTCAAV